MFRKKTYSRNIVHFVFFRPSCLPFLNKQNSKYQMSYAAFVRVQTMSVHDVFQFPQTMLIEHRPTNTVCTTSIHIQTKTGYLFVDLFLPNHGTRVWGAHIVPVRLPALTANPHTPLLKPPTTDHQPKNIFQLLRLRARFTISAVARGL